MTTIEKLELVSQICSNLIEETSVNDSRMSAMTCMQDGLEDIMSDLEVKSDECTVQY